MQEEIILYLQNPSGDEHAIPVFEGYNVSLNLAFNDIEQFKPTGVVSSTFRCPVDLDFQNFIGAVYDANYNGWFNPKNKIPARITANTLPLSEGHVQLTQMVHGKNGWECEFRYFGETPDIKTTLGDDKIKDLSDLSDLNHTLDYDNLNDDNLKDGNVRYFLIDKGQGFTTLGGGGTQLIQGNTFLSTLHCSDFTPAVPARWIWDSIWADAEFQIDSPSDFPDTLDDLWIPFFNGSSYPLSTDDPSDNLFQLRLDTADEFTVSTSYTVSDFTTMTEDFDNGNNVAANVFTAPYDGAWNMRFWATAQENVGNGDIVELLIRDASTNEILANSGQVTLPSALLTETIYINTIVYLQAGQTVKPSYKAWTFGANNFDFLGTAGYDTEQGTGFEAYEVHAQLSGYEVDMTKNAPDMRQIDFITSILKMFNCVVVPDRNVPRKLRIESMMDYLQSGDTVDWTGKVDKESIVIKSTNEIQARDLEFTYAKDGDALNKVYTEQQDRTFGMVRTRDSQLLTNLRSDFASGTKKVEIHFAPTPCNTIPGTNIPIPKFVNDSGEIFNAKPRILYHAFDADNFWVWDDDTSTITATSVRILSHFDSYDPANEEPGTQTLDLNFGQEFPPSGYLQSVFGSPYQNLFYLYWQNYIREIYDPSARIMEANFALSINDILTFGFDDVVWIKDSYWRVLDIQGYAVGTNTMTKVRLIKILTLDVDCEWSPYQSNINGTVTFLNADGVTTGAGTEECCNFFGYTWVGSSCFWNINRGNVSPNTSGLNNFGHGSQNTQPLPKDSISFVSGSSIKSGNFGARFGGVEIESGQGNTGAIMQGSILSASDDLGGIAAFGENAEVDQFGLHFGGGLDNNDRDTHAGRMQFGFIPFMGEGTLTNIGDKIEIKIKGSDRLVIPDETAIGCSLTVSYSHYNAAMGKIDEYGQQSYNFVLYKSDGVAGVTTTQIAPDQEDGSISAHLELEFDVTTDNTQHRMKIEAKASAGLPSSDLQLSALLTYTQVRAFYVS